MIFDDAVHAAGAVDVADAQEVADALEAADDRRLEERDADLLLLSYHEAGHAVASIALGWPYPDLYLRERDAPCYVGATGASTAVVAVAGPVAEAVQTWHREGNGVDGIRAALRSGAPLSLAEDRRDHNISIEDCMSGAFILGGGMADLRCAHSVVTEGGEGQLKRDGLALVLRWWPQVEQLAHALHERGRILPARMVRGALVGTELGG